MEQKIIEFAGGKLTLSFEPAAAAPAAPATPVVPAAGAQGTPATPVEPPPPPPVAQPVSTGAPKPTLIQGYKLNEATGVYESQPGWQRDIAALGFEVPGVDYGKTIILEFDRSGNYDPHNRNVKILRGWRDSGLPNVNTDKACNTYVGKGPTDWKVVYTEGVGQPASKQTTNEMSFPNPTMRRERFEIKLSTGLGKADGSITRYINGVREFTKDGWQFDTPERPGLPKFWVIQDDYSPNTPDAGPFPDSAWVKVKPATIACH